MVMVHQPGPRRPRRRPGSTTTGSSPRPCRSWASCPTATRRRPAPGSPTSPTLARRDPREVRRPGRGPLRRLRPGRGLDRFVWVAGLAEPDAPSYFSAGATGFTSGRDVAPAVSLNMIEALRAAMTRLPTRFLGNQIRRFEELRGEHLRQDVTVVKEALASLGLCRREVRPPSRELPESERGGSRRHRRGVVQMSREKGAEAPRGAPEPSVVRHRRAAFLQPPGPHPPARGPSRGAPRQAGHRDPEHLVRHQPRHVHLRDRAQAVKRGAAGPGTFPLEFPVSTLSQTFQ